jgi:hypothetical protein
MAQPAPPLGNPPPLGADAIPLPSFMAPKGGGDIENLGTALYGQDIGRLRELSVADMSLIATLYGTEEPQGTTQVMAHAIGVQSGPCSFLTILPTTPGNDPIVEVITGLRQYVRPATDGPAAMNDPLNNRTFAFLGDSFQPQLPTIQLEPANGFVASGQPGNVAVTTDDELDAYFTPHRGFGHHGGPASSLLADCLDAGLHRRGSTKGGLGTGPRTTGTHGAPASSPIRTHSDLDVSFLLKTRRSER